MKSLLKTACTIASASALMMMATWSVAADGVEHPEQAVPRAIVKDQSWSLRLPKDEKVVYKGVVNLNGAGVNSGSMLYPAPNVVGFVAAVITHGVLVESSRENQKDKLQVAADKVLLPYQSVLGDYKCRELMQRGLEKMVTGGRKKLLEASENTGNDWVIESEPVFSITQDQSAIIVDNAISIHSPENSSALPYQNTVRVISLTKEGVDLPNFWMANQGEKLKEESASLFAESLDIAVTEMIGGSSNDNNPYKTLRYLEGRSEKMERGQLVREHCNRMVIKTLRGTLISAPSQLVATVSSTAEQCGDTVGIQKN